MDSYRVIPFGAVREVITVNEFESMEVTARELLSLAGQHEFDLAPMYGSGTFLRDARIIWFWRKNGIIHYSLQGKVEVLPRAFQASADAFHDMWHEVGILADLQAAFELLKEWLIDKKEVDDLPLRSVKSQGIG
jgi:hypothetical protein